MNWSPDIVIYHHPCADGFGAAWACHTVWPDVEYVPANYGDAPPDVTGKNVLIVDFSYKRNVLLSMSALARSVVVLDHHETSEADLAEFRVDYDDDGERKFISLSGFRGFLDAETKGIVAHFDMSKSGAGLAWNFAHPDTTPPDLINLIEDRDLWRFHVPQSRPFATWLRTRPMDFDHWDMIAQDLHDAREADRIYAEANLMQAYHDSLVDQIAATAHQRTIGGHMVPAVNCPGQLASDVGHALLKLHPDAPFVATYSDDGRITKFSLRSEDARLSAEAVAKSYGGGGHRNAAGFKTDMPTWPLTMSALELAQHLNAASANFRSADKTEERTDAAWRIAHTLDGVAKELYALSDVGA